MPTQHKRILVIGSGFGGLGAACRLQARGYDVTILEARDQPGGRAYVYRQDGFTFDAGPTVITAPFLIDEIFEAGGRKTGDYVKIVPVDPFYKIAFHDGRSFAYNNRPEEIEAHIRAFAPGDLDGYHRMIARTKAIFEKGFLELGDKPFLKFSDMLRVAPDLIRLQSHKSVAQFVSHYIKDPMLQRVFSFHPLLVGGNPFQTTSIYALIHHLEMQWGVHYAMGGTGKLVEAMVRLFTDLGGKLHLSTPVREILLTPDRKVRGAETAHGEVFEGDAVVSNADVANTYRKMIPASARRRNTDRRLEGMRYSMSVFVAYFGTRKRYREIAHHTIILGERYRELLDDIFNKKLLVDDFSLYLHRPSATDPSMAPDGCDCFYVLAPVPHLESGTDWNVEGERYLKKVLDFLEAKYLPGLKKNLATSRYFTPTDFETKLNSYLGAAFSFEPVLTQSAWFRPHNESEDIGNLFFTGAGTHPGAGIPGVLCSSKIVEKLVCERLPL
ncbi:MAG: phytoene desaturase [Bryobacterales bacterium]|nr:phytoene desaturase [Bryobacterales bacterium]